MTETTPEQVEQALRLLYRLQLFARHQPAAWSLVEESAQLLTELPPGSIDALAEGRDGKKPSDQEVR